MCLVKCVDGYERLCHIRGKFTGRSKRENALSQGTWVLIGLRQWDADKEFASKVSKTDKKIQKCDLLEIYSASERDKLRVQEKIFQDVVTEGNNSDGSNGGGGGGSDSDDEFKAKDNIEFKDQKTLEYQEIVAQSGKLSKLSTTTSYHDIYSQISDSDDSDDDNSNDSDSDDKDDSDGDGGDDRDDNTQKDKVKASTATVTAAATAAATRQQYKQQQLEEVNIDDI